MELRDPADGGDSPGRWQMLQFAKTTGATSRAKVGCSGTSGAFGPTSGEATAFTASRPQETQQASATANRLETQGDIIRRGLRDPEFGILERPPRARRGRATLRAEASGRRRGWEFGPCPYAYPIPP